MALEAPDPAVVELLGDVAEELLAGLDQLGVEMDAAVLQASPALGADAAIAAEVSASNRANVRRLLTAVARRDGRPPPADVPAEALDVARTTVRRGIEDPAVIYQAYRSGQLVAWQRWLETASRMVPTTQLVAVLQLSSQIIFRYVDVAIGQVLAEAQREREELLGGALARRTEAIRLILDGAPIDRRRASERLGYELARRHTGLVLWVEPAGAAPGALESAATLLAAAVGARRPLLLAAGVTTLWAWLGTDDDPDPSALRDAIAAADPNVRVAVGPTHAGITGFRRTHAAAIAIQGLLAGRGGAERLAYYRELEVTALAAQDRERAADFVATTLGPLAADNATASRLRETLRVFIDEADNAPRAGVRLHTHRNTVLQRVARATELLGHPYGEHRLELALALELAHQLGPSVLAR
jgi:DNA-binding PucR family transcriptional regulator